MKTKKRFLTTLLICLAAVICLGCAAWLSACESDDSDELTYTLNDAGDGYIVSASNNTEIKTVKIPKKHEGLPVTEISSFYGCTSLESITIPKSVTTIQSSAFYGCSSLKSATIPNSVTSIGDQGLFRYCTSLETVKLGKGVTVLHDVMFDKCTSLKSVTFTSSVTTIEHTAFRDCSSLTDIYFKGNETQWKAIYTYDDHNWVEDTDKYFKAASVHFK